MNFYAIPPLITALILFSLGLFVFFKNKKSKSNIIFCLFSLSMVLWLFGYTNMYLSKNIFSALRWARIGFIGIVFIPIFAYHFITSFLNLKKKIMLAIIYTLAIPSLLLSQTDYIYSGIKKHFWGYYPTAGKIYIFFLVMFAILFTQGVLLLLARLRKETGIKREQLKYVCLAFGFGTFGIIDYLIKFPLVDIYPFGYICALLFDSLIAFAIVRYRFLNITALATRALIFITVYGVLLVLPLFSFFSSKFTLSKILASSNWWLLPFSIAIYAIIASIAPFVYLFFQRRAEAIMLRDQRRYQQALRELAKTMTRIRDLDQLLKTVTSSIVDTVKVNFAAIYINETNYNAYQIKHCSPAEEKSLFREIHPPGSSSSYYAQ